MRPSNYIWRLFSNDYIILQAVRILQNIITLVHNVSSLSFIAFTHIHHHIRRNRQNCFRLLRHDVIYVPDPRPRPTGSARPFVLCNHHHVAGGSIVGLCIVWWPVRCSWTCWAAASVATLLLSPEVSLSRSSAVSPGCSRRSWPGRGWWSSSSLPSFLAFVTTSCYKDQTKLQKTTLTLITTTIIIATIAIRFFGKFDGRREIALNVLCCCWFERSTRIAGATGWGKCQREESDPTIQRSNDSTETSI